MNVRIDQLGIPIPTAGLIGIVLAVFGLAHLLLLVDFIQSHYPAALPRLRASLDPASSVSTSERISLRDHPSIGGRGA